MCVQVEAPGWRVCKGSMLRMPALSLVLLATGVASASTRTCTALGPLQEQDMHDFVLMHALALGHTQSLWGGCCAFNARILGVALGVHKMYFFCKSNILCLLACGCAYSVSSLEVRGCSQTAAVLPACTLGMR